MTSSGIPSEDHIGDIEEILKDKASSKSDKFLSAMEYHNKVPSDTVHPIVDPNKWSNKHQTLIVVEVRVNPPFEFIDRSTRLCTSLNALDTMKADVLSLSDGLYYRGLVYTGTNPGGVPHKKVVQQAKEWGYNQCIVVSYCGKN